VKRRPGSSCRRAGSPIALLLPPAPATNPAPCVAGLPIKNPPKKNQKNHLKKPLKMFFWGFLNFFKFFQKIIQTFLFETDFL
jgi:hypothetical protein